MLLVKSQRVRVDASVSSPPPPFGSIPPSHSPPPCSHQNRFTRRDEVGMVLERELLIDNLQVLVHFTIVMSRWTGLAP